MRESFLKHIIIHIFVAVFITVGGFLHSAAHADISSVEYIHKTILDTKNITVPVDTSVEEQYVSSVRYLMKQIDAANEILNGIAITKYATLSSAVPNPVAASRAADDIAKLIKEFQPFILSLEGVANFSFQISSAGVFVIDWGDGTIEKYDKDDITLTTYSHTYPSSGNYQVKIRGYATQHNDSSATISAITFNSSANKTKIKTISGSLGAIFPTLNGKNPRFYALFNGCTGLVGPIPADLFSGISGQPVNSMYEATFQNCSNLTGPIPPGLFGNLSGAPRHSMFSLTFSGCSKLSGSIPSDLFGNISGAPAAYMYNNAFSYCSGLTGSIPAGLFGNIIGTNAPYMYRSVFYNCSGLSGSIPSDLFGNISGAPQTDMFRATFFNCSGLTGSIPAGLFGAISGVPAATMFYQTFSGCRGLSGSIPAGLFGTMTGNPAASMFVSTFEGCGSLTGIEDGIWDMSRVSDINAASMFASMFRGCSSITDESPSIAPGSLVKLWQHFTNYSGPAAFTGATNMADYANIPTPAWR